MVLGEEVLGYAYFSIEDRRGLIGDLYVRKDYARTDLASSLLSRSAEELLKNWNCERVETQLMLSDPTTQLRNTTAFGKSPQCFDRKKSQEDLAGLNETMALCKQAGLPVNIVSGGSTGAYNMDHEFGLTELECGSYVFMDSLYKHVGAKTNDEVYTDFDSSLSVTTCLLSGRLWAVVVRRNVKLANPQQLLNILGNALDNKKYA